MFSNPRKNIYIGRLKKKNLYVEGQIQNKAGGRIKNIAI